MNQNINLHINNNMISDALTAVAHDARTQTIAFSGLWCLLSEGKFHTNWSVAAAAKQLETEVTIEFTNECYTIFRELRCHQAAPGVSLCENNSVDINPELLPYIDIMRQMLHESLPEIAKASTTPVRPNLEYSGGMKLVKSRLNQQRFHDMPKVYKSIEALNGTGYKLNPDVMRLTNLPMDMSTEYAHRYGARQMDVLAASEFASTFHFRHTMDYRGRVYARSALIQPQGDSFAKASLNFADAKPLGEFGLGALAVHYANCSGHDKLSFVDRIKWAKNIGLTKAKLFHEAQYDWSLIGSIIEDSKHAFEEYVAGMELYRAVAYWHEHGEYATFESSIIVHQDATTSGFQFGAALLGDRETAALTNITGDCTKHDKPADLYGEMAKHLIPLVKEAAASEVNLAKFLTIINRNFCKKPIMTTGYGASLNTIMKHIGEYCERVERPELNTAYLMGALKPLVQQALEATASSMLQLSSTLRDAGKLLIDRGEETFTWTTPDGFTVYHQIRDASHRKIKLQSKSGIRALTSGEIDPLDESKMGTALPPNFVHSIDAQLVRTAALNCQSQGIALAAIHDSFGTHAGTFKALNHELRFAFAEVMEYDWFEEFRKSNQVQLLIERGDYHANEAILGTYMFS